MKREEKTISQRAACSSEEVKWRWMSRLSIHLSLPHLVSYRLTCLFLTNFLSLFCLVSLWKERNWLIDWLIVHPFYTLYYFILSLFLLALLVFSPFNFTSTEYSTHRDKVLDRQTDSRTDGWNLLTDLWLTYLPTYLSISLSIYLSYLSIYPSTYLPEMSLVAQWFNGSIGANQNKLKQIKVERTRKR